MRMHLKLSIKKAKEHYHSVTMKNFLLSSPAKFWRHFKQKKRAISNLCIDGSIITEQSAIVSSFNHYFSSVFTNDDGNRPHFTLPYDCPPIGDITVTEEGVFSLLLNTDSKKSPGIDGIPNAFLARYAEWCSKYLTLLFKESLRRAELPNDWKYGKIVPIPKTENPSNITLYRPISILCTCVKALEHIIFKHISEFLENNSIIDFRQHGFRKNLSTVTQLLETIHDFAASLDKRPGRHYILRFRESL